MAELSRSELDLLISGAQAIAQMRDLGIPQEEVQGILQAGAQRFGNTVSRGQTDGSFRFNKPFKQGESEIRPVAERTGAQTPRSAGAARDRPELTAQYIAAVVNKLKDADVGLKEALEAKGAEYSANDFGQTTINKGINELGSAGERELKSAGFEGLPEGEQGSGREYDVDAQYQLDKQARADRYEDRRQYQIGRQPRFANPVNMGYGGDVKVPDNPISRDEGFSPRSGQGIDRVAAATSLQRLQQAVLSGTAPATPETEELMKSLKLMASPAEQIRADRAEARKVMDENPVNLEAAARSQSDFVSEVDAERGRRRQGIFPGGRRGNDEAALMNLSRIGTDVVQNTNLVNDKGLPKPVTMDTAVAGSNTPDTNNNLNAPSPQSATEFVTQQVEGTGSGSMFGGKAENVADISGSLARLDQAIADLGGREVKVQRGGVKRAVTPFSQEMISGIGPIRSIDGLQQAANAILAVGQEAGVNFPQMVFTEGQMKAQQVASPGVGEVMQFLKMNAGDQQRLGVALNQVEQAGNNVNAVGNPINAEAKRRFRAGEPGIKRPDVIFGVKNMISANPSRKTGGGGQTPEGTLKSSRGDLEMETDLARLPADKAKRVKAAMRGPEGVGPASEDARMPYIGLEAGVSDRGTTRKFDPANIPEGMTTEQGIRAQAAARGQTGPAVDLNVEKALRVQQSAAKAEEDAAVRRIMQEAAVGDSMIEPGGGRRDAAVFDQRPDPLQAELSLRRRGSRRMY